MPDGPVGTWEFGGRQWSCVRSASLWSCHVWIARGLGCECNAYSKWSVRYASLWSCHVWIARGLGCECLAYSKCPHTGPTRQQDISAKMRSSHVPYIRGRWGMDWGSLGDRSGIIWGWFHNSFVRFRDGFWMVYH